MCQVSSDMIMVDVDKRCSMGVRSLYILKYKVGEVLLHSQPYILTFGELK